jgi:hypothetical protein
MKQMFTKVIDKRYVILTGDRSVCWGISTIKVSDEEVDDRGSIPGNVVISSSLPFSFRITGTTKRLAIGHQGIFYPDITRLITVYMPVIN